MADNSPGGIAGLVLRFALRLLQFVLALTVCGLYGQDLRNAAAAGVYSDSKWIYAVVVGSISAVTCVVYALPIVTSHLFFAWDALLWILWVAVFGVFGKLYIHEDPEVVNPKDGHGPGVQRMKNAVWVDLVNMLLWFITAVIGVVIFFLGRRAKTLHTGRSKV
ncbi:hypothetical protein P152DRAFT_388440 [Eremomyces bilateralis CBS 781.70]|uniref:MARVEL domain-containing protein n=1 Tax=Eremomyces bilateralis CBS 781.70 TaxID=1392243 RepID=A0A6G1GF82_9PEZI|nr:uncharacterized protein P152DRAFT_388440 [Eremomyces bilateralis CBS 781.70]KAF1816571.1 hypothetical protein P152DRAFT_388440 [Eremomyces bilateralis CBS 781.70]